MKSLQIPIITTESIQQAKCRHRLQAHLPQAHQSLQSLLPVTGRIQTRPDHTVVGHQTTRFRLQRATGIARLTHLSFESGPILEEMASGDHTAHVTQLS